VITLISASETSERSAVSTCALACRLDVTGVSGIVRNGDERLLGALRPTEAPATAVVAPAPAYAADFAANGAGEGRQKQQHHPMWAFRGHEPWRDPA